MEFEIFAKKNCVFCEKTRKILELFGFNYKMIYDADVSQFKLKYKHFTFPFIFHDGKFIGGFDELSRDINEGIFNKNIVMVDDDF